ncbi:uncharacterized protein LOC112681536 [Sipha flava]|uniref:Uncharacterized protein LOC112681536 n=1 Tax=Sipha flava TaxID=143950 RepID=A0A8B8F9U9_9HEMI|nr:uncharacterized protein LOC112681536 [Sipha flava]
MNNFELLCKWGCDGSSSQARYKQITSSNFNDSDIFMFSLVPLQLRCTKINNPKTILLWKNPRPSSTRYGRPIKFEYKKKTIESTLEEVNAVEEEIKSLIPTLVFKNNIEIRVKSTLMFTMVDGKICNTMTGSSSQKCYICKCSPKYMNDITRAKNLSVQPEHLKFGLSTLHAYIRFFECLIQISYRLEFKKWQISTISSDI